MYLERCDYQSQIEETVAISVKANSLFVCVLSDFESVMLESTHSSQLSIDYEV